MADETGTTPPTPAAAGAGNAQGAQETRPQLGIQTQYVKDLSFENPSALERPPRRSVHRRSRSTCRSRRAG